MPEWLKALCIGVGIPALLALNIAIVVNQVSFSGKQGEHTADIGHLKQDVVAVVNQIDKQTTEITAAIGKSEENLTGRLVRIEKSIAVKELDLGEIVIALGLAAEGDVFHAAVIDEFIWIFPGPDTQKKFESLGMQVQMAREQMPGFKLIPTSAIQGIE